MRWEALEANWESYQNQAKDRWGKLSVEELEATHGRRDRLIDKVRDCYRLSHEEAQIEVDSWADTL